MMQQGHLFSWVQEVERTMYEFSLLWEGMNAHEVDLGSVSVQVDPGFAAAMRLRFKPPYIDEQLDAIIERVEGETSRCLWIIGPSAQPADLEERFVARGFSITAEWQGLVLTDLSTEIARNPGITIELLSQENAEEYATAMTIDNNAKHHAYLLANARRYLQRSQQEAQIVLTRLHGSVVGSATSRIEANGILYLRNAITAPNWRRQGVYLSLLAHRLAVGKAAGCHAAVVQAIATTSAPILSKRGFLPVCRIVGLTRQPA